MSDLGNSMKVVLADTFGMFLNSYPVLARGPFPNNQSLPGHS